MTSLWIVSLLWAFSFPLIKGSLKGLDAAFVSLVRLFLSLIVFLPLWRPRSVPFRTAAVLIGIGAIQFGLMYVLYIESFKFLPAHTIVLLTTTTPLWVALIHDLLKRHINVRTVCGALLAVAAGAVVQYPTQPPHVNASGIALIQGSNIAFAIGQLAYRTIASRVTKWNDNNIFAFLYLGAVATAACFTAFRGTWLPTTLSLYQGFTLLYLGIVASGLGFFMWNRGARQVNGGTLAVMNNVKAPLGIIASLVLLSEHTNLPRLVLSIILMGIALALCQRNNVCKTT